MYSRESGRLLEEMRKDAVEIFLAGVRRVDPGEAVERFVRLEGDKLVLGGGEGGHVVLDIPAYERILVVGGGKATAPMAAALEEILGTRVIGGVVNVKYGFAVPLTRTRVVEADHPVPDQKGVEGTRMIMEILAGAGPNDLVFSLISGGGSALLPQPAGGITLAEKQDLTRRLLECGAGIDEINAVRKHISGSKGGQMARSAYPATTVNLMLSDVVGDRMDVIASGPFVPDTSTYRDAWRVLERYSLAGDLPSSIREHLEAGLEGRVSETPKQDDPAFQRIYNFVIGSNILALESAAQEAESRSYRTLILSSMIEGETREVAKVHTAIAKEVLKTGRPLEPPACIISGGETTVTIRGKGRGGRNQEFCLAACMEIADLRPGVVILSAGTDGNDGPTDAAGGVVDPGTRGRGDEAGMDAASFLDRNDAYTYLQGTGDLLVTGPTKTNVMDVRLLLLR